LSLNKDDRYETSRDWLKDLNAAAPPRHAKPGVLLHYLSNGNIWEDLKEAITEAPLRLKQILSELHSLRKRGNKR